MSDTVSRNEWALVTGASSGLGIELARGLAARGYGVVLTARRAGPMEELAAELRLRHGVEVVVEALDLAEPGAAAVLLGRLDERGIVPRVLINNAGFGLSSAFVEQEPEPLRAMLQLDIVALTELSHLFGRRMAADGGGGHILLVASMAAYQPTPLLAAYGAAKAYVLSLGISLNVELAAQKVGVTVLSPGLMETEFFQVSGYVVKDSLRGTMLAPAKVAEIGLEAMFKGKPSVIAGWLNRLGNFIGGLAPRHAQARMVFRMSAG